MGKFSEYIVESTFSAKDATKHTYMSDVVEYIISNKKILLGDKKVEKTISLNNDAVKEFEELSNDSNITQEKFDEIATKYGFRWTKIFKGTFSGHSAQSKGEAAEAVVCHLFNTYKGNSFDEAALNDCVENNVFNNWIESSKASVLKLISLGFRPSKYVALHVDGNDYDVIEDKYKAIAKIYKGKDGIYSVLGLDPKKKQFDSLYSRSYKDNWNKADIVLVLKSKNVLQQILKKKPQNPTELNSILNELVENKYIIPVSLKAIKKGTTPDKISFTKEGNSSEANALEDIVSINMKWPVKGDKLNEDYIEPKNSGGSCYLVSNNGIKMQFRKQTSNGENLSIELIFKHARGGKPISKIKEELTIKGNDYYVTFKSDNDLIKNLKKIKDLNVDKSDIPPEIKSIPGWYNKVCFKGLCGLINEFLKHFPNTSIVDFFKFIYIKAMGIDSNSIFYLLSMK